MSDLIPPGYYAAVAVPVQTEDGAVWAQFGTSQQKGTRQVYVAFAIIDGDHAGRRLGWFGYFTDGAVDRTIESLRLCGLKGDDLANAMFGPLDQEVQVVVEHEEYDGKVRAKVAWVNAPGGGAFRMANPMKSDELRKFSATMKGKLKGKPEVAGAKREPPATVAPPPAPASQPPPARQAAAPAAASPGWRQDVPPPKDDDIPF